MLSLVHLKTFLTAVRTGSFTQSAYALSLSQPAVSGHIAALEEELGVRLFERTGRRIVLTDAGRLVERAAREIMDREQRLRSELEDLGDCRGGTIRIGASRIMGVYVLPRILTAFRDLHPEVELRVSTHTAHTILRMVEDNAFDLAVVAEGDERLRTENVGAKRIGTDHLAVVAPAGGSYVSGDLLTPGRVAAESFILPGRGTASAQNLRRSLEERGIRLKSTIEMDDAGSIKRAVEEGAGLAVVSRVVVERELTDGRLVELTVPGWEPSRGIFMLWRQDRRFSRNTERFMDFLKARLSGVMDVSSSK